MSEHSHRYVIEAKDEFGWFDHAFFADSKKATKEAEYLRESFPSLRVVDRSNQLVIWKDGSVDRETSDWDLPWSERLEGRRWVVEHSGAANRSEALQIIERLRHLFPARTVFRILVR